MKEIPGNWSLINVKSCPNLGITRGDLMGYLCPRCNKNDGYVGLDGQNSFFFCAQSDCLDADSDASKAIARREKEAKEQSDKSKEEVERRENLRIAFGQLYHNANLSQLKLGAKKDQELMSWLQYGNNFWIFVGSPGCGKTYFCAAVYFWLLAKTSNILYVNCRVFISNLHDHYDDAEGLSKMLNRYKRVGYLILEDLGEMVSRNSDWQKDLLLQLIDYRYEHCLPTLITSNLDEKKMIEKLDSRISSRIFDRKNAIHEDWQTNYRKR